MRLRFLLMVSGAFALLLAALAAGCGGGGEALTLEEYFTRLDQVFEDAEAQFGEVEEPDIDIEDPNVPLEQKKEAVREFFNGFLAIVDDVTAGLEALDAPAEVQDHHADLNASATEFRQGGEDTLDKVDDVQSDSEFEALGEEFFSSGEQGFTDACLALQAIADDNNIAVDLECEEEGE